MSKLTDTLHELGRAAPRSIGFGPQRPADRTATMLLIGSVRPAGLKAHAGNDAIDALLITDGDSLSTKPEALKGLDGRTWGVISSAPAPADLDRLKQAGCDFVVPEAEDGPAVLLRDDDMARGYTVDTGLTEEKARALEYLPIDFLILEAPADLWPLKLSGLLKLQSTISLVSRHILLRVSAAPGEDDLVALRDLPVDGLLVDLEAVSAVEVKKIRARLDALPARKPRSGGKTDATLPPATGQPAGPGHDEEWDDDWDDE